MSSYSNSSYSADISEESVTVRKYRKKPVVIEAVQYDGGNATEIRHWTGVNHYSTANSALSIDTLEGTMRAEVGDWIIRGVQGEFYPCKPGIFDATYEAVE